MSTTELPFPAVTADPAQPFVDPSQPVAANARQIAETDDAKVLTGFERAKIASTAIDLIRSHAKVAEATTVKRRDLFMRRRISDAFAIESFGAVCYVVLGSDLPDHVGGVELWLSMTPAAQRLLIEVYSRPIVGASEDGPGAPGDVLILSDYQFPIDFPKDGEAHRLPITFTSSFIRDESRMYMLRLEVQDVASQSVGFGFSTGEGPRAGTPGYPQTLGWYFSSTADRFWQPFSEGSCAPIKWQSIALANARVDAVQIAAITDQRQFTVGAPRAILGAVPGNAAPGTWWNELPVTRTGLVTELFATTAKAGPLVFVFSSREADGSFVDRVRVPVLATGAGHLTFPAGDEFDAFVAEKGWFVGLAQNDDIVRYTAFGSSFWRNGAGVVSFERSKTLAFGATLSGPRMLADVQQSKRRRTAIYDELLNSTVAPIGWDVDADIRYTVDGMSLASGGGSYGVQVHTNRWVRSDKRLTRYLFQWTTADSVIGFAQVKAYKGDIDEAAYGASTVVIDGRNDRIWIQNSGDGGHAAETALGFHPVVGHLYQLDVGLDGFIHTVTVTDLKTNARSPLLIWGDADSATGEDGNVAPGLQNSEISILYPAGNVQLKRVSVFYDGPSPQWVVLGDSISRPVQMPSWAGWVGRARAEGIEVLCSAQPGGSTEGARRCSMNEVVSMGPRYVIPAVGANDALHGTPPADYKWQLAFIIDQARRAGAKIVLPVLHPFAGYDAEPYRAVVRALAAGADDVILWRWDIALTVNGDGVTPDPSLMKPDMLHPNENGAAALLNRKRVDVADAFD